MRGPLAGVILAAGHSRRFGADKRQAFWRGKPLLHHVIDTLQPAVDELIVVLRPTDRPDRLLPDSYRGRITVPTPGGTGMGDSLAAGISACGHCRAALVTPGDLPLLRLSTVQQVSAGLAQGRLVQPVHGGRPGHPVAFDRHYFPQLKQLAGDRGARRLLAANPVHRIEVTDPGIYRDIDTQEQLDAFANR